MQRRSLKRNGNTIMKKLTIQGMAKINLGLDVIRRREDGYHEVKMVMQTLNLCDTLTIEKSDTPSITIQVGTAPLPADENNLIYKSANLLIQHCNLSQGVSISLQKEIPIAAGMAGGSTDSAATLLGMNQLFALGLSLEELQKLGVKIGADVPYCLQGGTALSEGIGEILTTLPAAPDCFVVVGKPEISVSTKYVYENLHANSLQYHPDIDGMVAAITNKDLDGITKRMENVLETVTEKEYPVITDIKDLLKEKGAENALMSGSGPTVFGIFTEEERAREAREALQQSGLVKQSFVTTFSDRTGIVVSKE